MKERPNDSLRITDQVTECLARLIGAHAVGGGAAELMELDWRIDRLHRHRISMRRPDRKAADH